MSWSPTDDQGARRLAEDAPYEIHLRIPGTEIHYEVGVPRVPIAGDLVSGPDDTGPWRVSEVVFEYDRGFAFQPIIYVIAKPA